MITTPSTHLFKMRTTPYKHQQQEFEKSRDMEYYGFLWEMGCGKSKPLIDTMAWLYLKQEIDGVLIVSDKGAYLNWYFEEITKHIPEGISYRLVYWSSYMNRLEQAKVDVVMTARDDCLDIMCMNVEALGFQPKKKQTRAFDIAKQFIKNHYCMMIVDESTSIKNPKADRTKACWELGALCDYRRIATGTPITQSPLDLFGQCQFLKQGVLGYHSFVAFRAYYAEMITINLGTRSFQTIAGFRNLDQLSQSIKPFTSRILKTECLDLPPKVYETIYIEQTIEQKRAYEDLKEKSLLQFTQGMLTSTSALTTINKLHQINCGHVKIDDGTTIDIPSNRIKVMVGILSDMDPRIKVIIWCGFQRDVELIVAALEEVDDKRYPVHYYGKTGDNDRLAALSMFRTDPLCSWFVGTAATGGKAITLVESNYTFYYSNTYNLEDRLQSEDRNHRIGQVSKVTYVDLIVRGTIDQRIVKALRMKQDLASKVLDDYRELI